MFMNFHYFKECFIHVFNFIQLVGEKVGHCLEQGLSVLVCVGEQLSDREAGNTNKVVSEQMRAIAGREMSGKSNLIAA